MKYGQHADRWHTAVEELVYKRLRNVNVCVMRSYLLMRKLNVVGNDQIVHGL